MYGSGRDLLGNLLQKIVWRDRAKSCKTHDNHRAEERLREATLKDHLRVLPLQQAVLSLHNPTWKHEILDILRVYNYQIGIYGSRFIYL